MKFKKSLAIFLCLALLLTTGAGAALASAKLSAKILSLDGDVQVIRAGGEKSFKAFANMRLTEGDRIITGTDGWAEIQLDDQAVITLSENTRVYLSELRGSGGAQQSSIGLQAGGVGSAVNKKLEENSRFEIKTPTAVMGVRGTEFFTQYFAGAIDVRVVDGFVDVTVELSEDGYVAGGGSAWSGSSASPGDPSALDAELFTFQLGPLKQVLFGEGAQASQLPGQVGDLSLEGMPEKFIQRVEEIEEGQPGTIPATVLDGRDQAREQAKKKAEEQNQVAKDVRGEYDFRYTAHIVDGDIDRGLPGFAPEGMEIPALEPEPVDTGGGGGGGTSGETGPTEPVYPEGGIIVRYSNQYNFETYGEFTSNNVYMESDDYYFKFIIDISDYLEAYIDFQDQTGSPIELDLDSDNDGNFVTYEPYYLDVGDYFMTITVDTIDSQIIREIEIHAN